MSSTATRNAVTSRHVTPGELQQIVLRHIADGIRLLRVKLVKQSIPVEGRYTQQHGYELPAHRTVTELSAALGERLDRLTAEFAEAEPFAAALRPMLAALADPALEGPHIWAEYQKFLDLYAEHITPFGTDTAVEIVSDPEGMGVAIAVIGVTRRGEGPAAFIEAVTELLAARRRRRRPLSREEVIAVRCAYSLLDAGARGDMGFQIWGASGFRKRQTYMSVTDPGEGHIWGTTADNANLDGTIVHIEHLERGRNEDRESLEPYRIPAIRTVSRVRLHVGQDAPISSYVGRPMFEGDVDDSMLKTVHTLAASCSALFAEGLAECKIAIERMTARQAVDFMRALAVNVRRDPHRQILSAAFNLNTPLLDDRPETLARNGGRPVEVTDRYEVGRLGIELTVAGWFDKVTWDGTANSYPSNCVIEQIPHSQAQALVHHAHEVGLLTYFSAGFRFHHLPKVVWIGTDGVGVGGAQILRYMDKETGNHGPFLEENIGRLLDIRNDAAASLPGRAGVVLARLDRMYFEGSLPVRLEGLRQELYEACAVDGAHDEARLAALLEKLAGTESREPDTEHPLLAWAARLLEAGDACLAARYLGAVRWHEFAQRLTRLRDRRDLQRLAEHLRAVSSISRDDRTVSVS